MALVRTWFELSFYSVVLWAVRGLSWQVKETLMFSHAPMYRHCLQSLFICSSKVETENNLFGLMTFPVGCRWYCGCPSCSTQSCSWMSSSLCWQLIRAERLLSALNALSRDGQHGPQSHPRVRARCCALRQQQVPSNVMPFFYGVVLKKKGQGLKRSVACRRKKKKKTGWNCNGVFLFIFCLLVSVFV